MNITDIRIIRSGDASLGEIAAAFEAAGKDSEAFAAVREATRQWLISRVNNLTEMAGNASYSEREREFFQDGASIWREALDKLVAGQTAFIRDHINAATGIYIPVSVEDNRLEFMYK